MDLQSANGISGIFKAFVRQNTVFIENFSIGLRYQAGTASPMTITLTRYNGPHGESKREPNGHYARSHIHRITAQELASGSIQPQEKEREITNRFSTLEEALVVFFQDIGVTNYFNYFPEIQQGSFFGNGQPQSKHLAEQHRQSGI